MTTPQTTGAGEVARRFVLPDGREALSCAVYTSYPAAYEAAQREGWRDVSLKRLDAPRDGCNYAWVAA